MKQSFNIFLLVAEEMNIGRAARRAFVTQQCVSDHIRRLEQEYEVALFERKPSLHLTKAGETLPVPRSHPMPGRYFCPQGAELFRYFFSEFYEV